ncbi:hypothetical protein M3Y99_00655000 [Aphelenchoides fujianensis]|nr:hypothetical protein M3Y99_00655000 [Aphelenchoides fujianensis]
MNTRSLLIASVFVLLAVCGVDAKRRRPRPANTTVDRLPALCSGHEAMCSEPEHQAMMKRLCARTCEGAAESKQKQPSGFSCANPERDQLVRECQQKSSLCRKPEWHRMMAKYCCKTCTQLFANQAPSTTTQEPVDSKDEKAGDEKTFGLDDDERYPETNSEQ